MGAHHFKFHLIPAGGHVGRDADGDLPGDLLVGHKIAEDTLAKLRALLPKSNPWGAVEEFNSASEWGSDIRLYVEKDGSLGDITMRYSPVADPIETLEAFVRVTKEAGCDLVVDSTGEVIAAEFESVLAALRKHRAFRFVSDPQSVIKEAARVTNEKG